jgi:NAD(P)-dependent dehydrogenase (short-subunit alcohol dehydrogenase family)
VRGAAREVARHNVTINNLLPGPYDTCAALLCSAHCGLAMDRNVPGRRAGLESATR